MKSKEVIEQLVDAHRLIRDAAYGLQASGRAVLGKDLESKAKSLGKTINVIHESVTLDAQTDLSFMEKIEVDKPEKEG